MRRRRTYDTKRQRRQHEEQERVINEFCAEHKVKRSASGKSYYFKLRGKWYRVSDHSRRQSDFGMYDQFGNEIRKSYNSGRREEIEIVCGKTKFMEVYRALKAGKNVDSHGVIMD